MFLSNSVDMMKNLPMVERSLSMQEVPGLITGASNSFFSYFLLTYNDQICLPWIIMVAMNRITNTKRTIRIVILPLGIAIIDLIIKNTMTKKEIFVEH